MITKYRTDRSQITITPVECTRESAQCVWYLAWASKTELRAAKVADWARYHDTWEDAHAYLMSKAERAVAFARSSLASAQGALGNVKGMKKPETVD